MASAEEHAAAIEALNESEVGGRIIYVSESVPKEKYAANRDKFDAPRKSKCRTALCALVSLMINGICNNSLFSTNYRNYP